MQIVKKVVGKLKHINQRIGLYYSINWTKTLYFNFKKFPFKTAKKLPVFFYGKVKFQSIKGEMIIDGPIKRGMIGFGQPYEIISRSRGNSEFFLEGKMVFKGHVQFGKDYFIYIAEKGYCEMGHMASLGNSGKLICYNRIVFGKYARIGFESQVMDSNFHQMIDTLTGEKYPMTLPIILGNYNYFGNRISVMQKTNTPNFCTVASNSICNNDYTLLGENILIGGIPAKLLKNNISRDWEGEDENLEKWLIV